MVVIRGNNLHPAALQTILHRFDEVAEYQVEIDQAGSLANLRISLEPTKWSARPSLSGPRRTGDPR